MVTEFSTPPNYTFERDLFADFDGEGSALRFLLIGNLWALIPLSVAIVILWLPYQFYVALGAPLALFPNPTWAGWLDWVIGAVSIAASMPLHEGLHGLVLWLTGYHPRFNFAGGFLYAGLSPDEFITRRHYLLMVLAPVLLMTFGGGALLPLLPPRLGQIALIVLLLNSAASVGDLVVADRVRRCPADALFASHDGIKVFTRR